MLTRWMDGWSFFYVSRPSGREGVRSTTKYSSGAACSLKNGGKLVEGSENRKG